MKIITTRIIGCCFSGMRKSTMITEWWTFIVIVFLHIPYCLALIFSQKIVKNIRYSLFSKGNLDMK